MPNLENVAVKFKKKTYNQSTDNGNGIVVFDTTSHKIYVGGVCYSSDVSDASFNSQTNVLTITKRDNTSFSVTIPTTLSGLTDTTITTPTDGQVLTYNSGNWVNANAPTEIPSQSGNSGKFLTTDGSDVSWGDVDKIYVEKTYSQLCDMINNGTLVKGQKYRITDYVTTTTTENTSSAGHDFDLVVTATDTNKLDCMAQALPHSGDTYFSTAGADLTKWQVWYDINNDTTKYAWASSDDAINSSDIDYIKPPYDDLPSSFKQFLEHESIDYSDDDVGFWYNETTINTRYYLFSTDGGESLTLDYNVRLMDDEDYTSNMDATFYEYDVVSCNLHVGLINGNKIIIGKGVIYRLIDEWGNDCPYDFKNILFTVSGKTASSYTFNVYSNSTCSDHSLNGRFCYGNVMKPSYNSGIQTLNFNVFYNTSNTSNCHANTFGNYCYSNTFGNSCYSNTFGNSCSINRFGNNCYFNTFMYSCDSNTFGDSCHSNTFVYRCSSNIFGYSCNYNTFGNGCESNTFGDGCESNTFGDGCSSNTFRNHCNSNTFSNYCYSNTFGNGCESNTFGDGCSSNTFGNDCYYNTFGNYCYSNTFGNGCESNTFGNNCYYNKFVENCQYNNFGDSCNHIIFGNSSTTSVGGTYCRYNIIENGNQYIRLYQTTNEDYSNYLQNIYIAQGVNNNVNNTNTYVDISTIDRNLSYRTTVAKLSDGTICIYNEDETTTIDVTPIREVEYDYIFGNAGDMFVTALYVDDYSSDLIPELEQEYHRTFSEHIQAICNNKEYAINCGTNFFSPTVETMTYDGNTYRIWMGTRQNGESLSKEVYALMSDSITYSQLQDMSMESDINNRYSPFVAIFTDQESTFYTEDLGESYTLVHVEAVYKETKPISTTHPSTFSKLYLEYYGADADFSIFSNIHETDSITMSQFIENVLDTEDGAQTFAYYDDLVYDGVTYQIWADEDTDTFGGLISQNTTYQDIYPHTLEADTDNFYTPYCPFEYSWNNNNETVIGGYDPVTIKWTTTIAIR